MTFEPNGGSGDPDDIAIHHDTVAAFHAVADGAGLRSRGRVEVAAIVYTAIRRSFFLRMRDEMDALAWIRAKSPGSKKVGAAAGPTNR